MSAYICNGKTFNILFSFMASRIAASPGGRGLYLYKRSPYVLPVRDRCMVSQDHYYNAHTLTCVLVCENYFSVNTRYHATEPVSLPDLHPTPYPWTLPEVARAIKDLEYQSCEADDYYESLAYATLGVLKNEVLSFICERASGATHSDMGHPVLEAV